MKSLKRVWDRSLPRPVGETGRRSVGNGKERLRDYASFPGRQPNVPMREAPKGKDFQFLQTIEPRVANSVYSPGSRAPKPSASSGRNKRGGAWEIARSSSMLRLCELPGLQSPYVSPSLYTCPSSSRIRDRLIIRLSIGANSASSSSSISFWIFVRR